MDAANLYHLLVDPVGDQALPVHPTAFTRLTGPKSRVMARNVVALFLTPEGQALHIEDIEVADTGLRDRLRLAFGAGVPAHYDLQPVDISVEDMRTMLIDAGSYMRLRPRHPAWWLSTAPLDEISAQLAPARTLKELYARVPFPTSGTWMDLL